MKFEVGLVVVKWSSYLPDGSNAVPTDIENSICQMLNSHRKRVTTANTGPLSVAILNAPWC